MVLTEEQQTDAYPAASMETAQSTTENLYYSNINTTRIAKPSGYPTDTYTNPNDYVAKVRGDGNKIGPAMVLKVMAGDKFNLRVSSWWNSGSTPGTPVSPLNDLISALSNGVAGVSGGKATATELTSTGISNTAATGFLNSQSYNSSKPKAFVNWIFLDEQFKYYSGGFEQVDASNTFKTHLFTDVAINKSGYLYVYVSNETPNIDVYFDNLQVTHIRGPLLETNEYYPFGLQMANLCYRALKSGYQENKFLYNGYELNEDFDLNLYETFYRSHDPQLGKFWQIDPKSELSISISPYAAMNNNPVSRVDPLGDNDYKVNEKGEITLVKETKDETDRLIAVSGKKEKIEYKKDGTLKNASITLDKGIIAGRTELQQEVTGDGGKETVNYMRLDFGKNEEAAQKTFEFLANNTGVEWSLVTAGYKFEGEPEGTTSSIYTSHKEDKEYFGGQAALDKASNAGTWLNRLEHTHNHPRAFGEDDLRGEHSAADGDFRTKVTQKFPGTKVFIFENGTRYEYTQYQNKKKKN